MDSSKHIFSADRRETLVKELESRNFDLLIIGGGITGAGQAGADSRRLPGRAHAGDPALPEPAPRGAAHPALHGLDRGADAAACRLMKAAGGASWSCTEQLSR